MEEKSIKVDINAEIIQINEKEMFYEVTGYVLFEYSTDSPSTENISIEEVRGICPFYPDEKLFANALETKESDSSFSISNGLLKGSIGFTSTVGMQLNYQRFPYDRQILSLELANPLKITTFKPLDISWFGLLGGLSETWITEIPTLHIGETYGSAALEFQMPIERKPKFFISKIAFPLIVLCGLGLCAFAFPAAQLEGRMAVTLTLVLSSVAFLYIFNQYIPPISYLTVMDYHIMFVFIILFLTAVESSTVSIYADNTASLRIDKAFFIFYGVSYLTTSLLIIFGKYMIMPKWEQVRSIHLQGRRVREQTYKYSRR